MSRDQSDDHFVVGSMEINTTTSQPSIQQTGYLWLDVSGSTGGSSKYYDYAQSVYHRLCEMYGAANVMIYFWDDRAVKVNEDSFITRCQSRSGGEGTSPQVMAPADLTPEGSDLVIITDGQIDASSSLECDRAVGGRAFNRVTIHFVDTGGSMDLSISTAFTRNCAWTEIFEVRDEPVVLAACNTRDPVVIEKYFNNPELFLEEINEVIRPKVLLQNIGTVNTGLINSLRDLKNNLKRELASRPSAGVIWDDIRKCCDWRQLITLLRGLVSGMNDNPGMRIEREIEDLIRLCNGMQDFSFDNIRPGRLARAADLTVQEVPTDIPGDFPCPILFDDTCPALCINEGEPVLGDIDKGYVDAIITNPLLVLDNPTLVQAITARIGHPFGLGIVAELIRRGDPTCPITRKPISAMLIPYYSTDPAFDRNNSHALADIFFGKRLPGNKGLWLVVIWRVLCQIQYIPTEFMSAMESYLVVLWRSTNTMISLSGLAAPMLLAPTDVAMLYCVASEAVSTNCGSIVRAADNDTNRLRSFGYAVRHLLPCLDLLGFQYPYAEITQRIGVFRTFGILMSLAKKDNNGLRDTIRALHQNSLLIDGKFVFLDGPPSEQSLIIARERMVHYGLTDPIELINSLMDYVDIGKTVGVIALPYAVVGKSLPTPVVNYGYPELNDDDVRPKIPICPKTLRPFVFDRVTQKHWLEQSVSVYGPLDGQISNNQLFIDCVAHNQRYPTKLEFIAYSAQRMANRLKNPRNTLPKYQVEFVDSLFERYENVLGVGFADVPVSTFISVTRSSMNVEIRGEMDGSWMESPAMKKVKVKEK